MSKQTSAISTYTGARKENEDYENVISTDSFTAVVILDGHGGDALKNYLGKEITSVFTELFNTIPGDTNLYEFVELLKKNYYEILERMDKLYHKGGSTLSIGIFQKQTKDFYTLQLGDSMVFMSDCETGNIINACKIFELDIANPEKDTDLGYSACVTEIYDYSDENEVELYKNICKENNKSFSVSKRKDAVDKENRYLAKVGYTDLSEPSRTIEKKSIYNNCQFILELQRAPVFSVWDLGPIDCSMAMCAVCDGFGSKLAVPNNDSISQAVINPGLYIQRADILDGSVLGDWVKNKPWWNKSDLIKPDQEDWGKDPIINSAKLVHLIAPDKLWKDSVQTAIDSINEIKDEVSLDDLRVTRNIQQSVNLSVFIPSCLASDDNVSCCVALI
jgi:hypothetical protein